MRAYKVSQAIAPHFLWPKPVTLFCAVRIEQILHPVEIKRLLLEPKFLIDFRNFEYFDIFGFSPFVFGLIAHQNNQKLAG